MTKEEFIKGYCERSFQSWEDLNEYLEAIPCDCGLQHCEGWQMTTQYANDDGVRYD